MTRQSDLPTRAQFAQMPPDNPPPLVSRTPDMQCKACQALSVPGPYRECLRCGSRSGWVGDAPLPPRVLPEASQTTPAVVLLNEGRVPFPTAPPPAAAVPDPPGGGSVDQFIHPDLEEGFNRLESLTAELHRQVELTARAAQAIADELGTR